MSAALWFRTSSGRMICLHPRCGRLPRCLWTRLSSPFSLCLTPFHLLWEGVLALAFELLLLKRRCDFGPGGTMDVLLMNPGQVVVLLAELQWLFNKEVGGQLVSSLNYFLSSLLHVMSFCGRTRTRLATAFHAYWIAMLASSVYFV